jgi:hypothetical protein
MLSIFISRTYQIWQHRTKDFVEVCLEHRWFIQLKISCGHFIQRLFNINNKSVRRFCFFSMGKKYYNDSCIYTEIENIRLCEVATMRKREY